MPNVLRGVADVDLSVTVMGQKLALPVYCSPTALQRLFHHDGERAVAAAAGRHGTLFGVSSLGTVSLEKRAGSVAAPGLPVLFPQGPGPEPRHDGARQGAGVQVMMLTVDSITGGNRERDKRTGFAIPFRLNLAGIAQFMAKPGWALNYFTHERFRLPQLDGHVDMGGGVMSISRYFTEMLDPSMTWDDVAEMVAHWGGQFCLKGVMSVEDARRAADIGCTGIVLSNHGGRQLDGSRSDQLAEIVDAVGDRIDVMMDGGVQRSTHVLKSAVAGRQGRGAGTLLPVPVGGRRPAGEWSARWI